MVDGLYEKRWTVIWSYGQSHITSKNHSTRDSTAEMNSKHLELLGIVRIKCGENRTEH